MNIMFDFPESLVDQLEAERAKRGSRSRRAVVVSVLSEYFAIAREPEEEGELPTMEAAVPCFQCTIGNHCNNTQKTKGYAGKTFDIEAWGLCRCKKCGPGGKKRK